MRARLIIAIAAICFTVFVAIVALSFTFFSARAQVTNVPCNQLPALTGDTTSSAASCATTTTKINGVDMTTAWTTFTPSLACGTATFTVNSARSKTLGKTTWAEIDFTITAIGSCTNPVTFTLPNTANSAGALSGQDIVVGFQAVACAVAAASTTATCQKNAQVAFLLNARVVVSGVYENQ